MRFNGIWKYSPRNTLKSKMRPVVLFHENIGGGAIYFSKSREWRNFYYFNFLKENTKKGIFRNPK